jgi:flavin-dependent dehydrogenase
MSSSFDYDVIVAGGGPAGSSAAIRLATSGARVLLAEQKKFPRAKLCGEFISPECLHHFERLGVSDRMAAAGGARLTQTVFYSRGGRSVNVPSEWFSSQAGALGLSRAEMDNRLLERAREAGAEVLEDTQVCGLIIEGQRMSGVRFKSDNVLSDATAPVTIDATGRTRALARRLNGDQGKKKPRTQRPPFVAFKAHLENAQVAPGACEIYFYPGGYGGLSSVENGLSNLCFIASARDVRACESDAERVMREVVTRNSRAAYTLGSAQTRSEWLGVSLESFGRREPVPADGLLTIGDAAAFIDPFTGSGMLMALESGEAAAGAIIAHLQSLKTGAPFDGLAREYRTAYRRRFESRLRVCAWLRRAAFMPRIAEAAILLLGTSDRVRRRLARATRKG